MRVQEHACAREPEEWGRGGEIVVSDEHAPKVKAAGVRINVIRPRVKR